MTVNRPGGMRAFTIVWLGQLASMLGTTMTQFALTIWSWRFVTEVQPVDDPAFAMALVGLFNFAPAILFSPIAGALVDRWNRKTTMMLVDLAAGISTIAIFMLYSTNNLQIWHLYVAGAFTGIFQSFHFPAYSSAISMMVSKEQYARADAMLGLVDSATTIFAPIIASFFLGIIGIAGIMLIDIVSFLAAIGTLLFVHIPQPAATAAGAEGKGSLLTESVYGFRYIFARPSLLGLQLVFFFGNFLHGLGFTVLAPMILSRTGNNEMLLGFVQSAFGVGGVIGGVLLAAWGGLKRRVHGVLAGWIISSLFGTVLMGLGQALPVWLAAAFFGAFAVPFINGSNQAIWQSKVAPDVQGRVFASRRLIAQITFPVATVLSGLLADRVFEPGLSSADGSLAATFGPLVGVGPGAGMSLMFIIAGFLTLIVGVVGYLTPVIRNAEDILPDHDARPVDAAAPATADVGLVVDVPAS